MQRGWLRVGHEVDIRRERDDTRHATGMRRQWRGGVTGLPHPEERRELSPGRPPEGANARCINPVRSCVGLHPANGKLDIVELGRPARVRGGIDEAVVDAESHEACLGELPRGRLHVRAAAGPHATTVDEHDSGSRRSGSQRPLDIQQQRFIGPLAVDNAAFDSNGVLVQAGHRASP